MVVRHIMQYWEMLKKIDVMRFFYYNYFCDKVIRMDGSKLLPYRNSIIVLEEDAKVYVCNGDLELGCDKQLWLGFVVELRGVQMEGAKYLMAVR